MLLLELGSELPNIIKRFQSVLKIWAKCRLNFNKVECTGGNHPVRNCQGEFSSGVIVLEPYLTSLPTRIYFCHVIC